MIETAWRVGIGFDVHPLTDGAALVIGGVRIASEIGLSGHSDADVLCHAVADALLGATADGDLGTHFPSSDASLAGIASTEILRQVVERVSGRGWAIENVDTVIIAERPRLAEFLGDIRLSLATCLQLSPEAVGVKATTTDRLGTIGRGEGMAAQAVALLRRSAQGQG